MRIKISHIVIILLCINIGLFVFNMIQKSHYHGDNLYDYFYAITRKKSEIMAKNELQPINPLFYIGKDTTHAINISNNISTNILCYYFSSQTCPPCLDHIYELIKKIFPDYMSRNDIIFISNDLEFRLRDDFYHKKIFWNNNKKLNMPLEKAGIPTFFILDKDLQAKCVFLADKMTPEYIEDYLKIIKQRFFSNE